MNRFHYYEHLKTRAREVRVEHSLVSVRVLRSDLRRIYSKLGVRIDSWPHKFKQVRGAYFDDELGPTVMLPKHLPVEPTIFSMAHELKHHLVDRRLGMSYCSASNDAEPIEIGAEIFAAELIFPEPDFIDFLNTKGVKEGECTPVVLIRLKHETETTLSYASLAKRAEFLQFAPRASLAKVKWKKLEEEIYGEPIYKRVLRRRNPSRGPTFPYPSGSRTGLVTELSPASHRSTKDQRTA
jgi:Zn-dependent peptidase ImmA (M78 family)